MITNFKLFENNEPKFEIGDEVCVITDPKKIKCIIVKVYPAKTNTANVFDMNNFNYYVLDNYPHMTIREDQLIGDYEIDAKKYNL
jgi:hypothetical protein